MQWHNVFFNTNVLNFCELFFRATVLYFCLLLSAKAIGHRQVGIITPHNFIVAAGLSHIAASRMVNPESRPIDAIVIIGLYTVLNMFLSFMALKTPSLVLQKPILIVENGKVNKENLSKANLTIHNLMFHLRLKDAFSIKNVSYAYVEPLGEFSVLMNGNSSPPEKSLINIQYKNQGLPEVLIYKGDLDEKVMKRNSLDNKWLQNELLKNGVTDVKDVFLGILEGDKTLYLSN